MSDRNQECGTCRYWLYAEFNQKKEKIGRCRINPPAFVPNQEQQLDTEMTIQFHRRLTHFPVTREDAWCGKWEAREE